MLTTASVSHHLEKYIKTIKAMNKVTARVYNFRLGYFDSFVSNDYRINLDEIVEQIKKGSQDPYDILNDYICYLQQNSHASPLTLKQWVVRKKYEENANTVKAFLDDRCAIDLTAPEYFTLTTDVYNQYLIFCKERNERAIEMNVFGKRLAEEGIEKERIRYYGGQREYCYMGIKLRSDLGDQNKSTILN